MKFGEVKAAELAKQYKGELLPLDNSDEFELVYDDFASVPCIEFGEMRLVGHGEQSRPDCGVWDRFIGCDRIDLHNRVKMLKVKEHGHEIVVSTINKVYVRDVFKSCDKPSCPSCMKFGWAVREANRIEHRLAEAVKLDAFKKLGQVEHIVLSVPVRDYGLGYDVLLRKAKKILMDCGVVGGAIICHGFRYHKQRHYWFFAPHVHALAFVYGGFQCRKCKHPSRCAGCGGFNDTRWQVYQKTGWYCKVLAERETVGGSAWYQLNHASLKKGAKRDRVVTWFGVCSYRRLKVVPEKKRAECPICRHELERLRYMGVNRDVHAQMNRMLCNGGKRDFLADFYEGGREAWAVDIRRREWW